MSHLFVVDNNIARPNTETLLITPFKEIWERDSSKNKTQAIKEFTYIEFMSSKKKSNPYAGYEESVRHQELKKLLFSEDWSPDIFITGGIKKVDEFQEEASPTFSYYKSVLSAAEKMKDFFNTFDINEVNDKGARVFKINEITSAIAGTDRVLQNLHSMKEKVEQELFESVKTRNNREINPYEV